MTTPLRLGRDLPTILGDLAIGPYPDYIDDVLATTVQRRQRPARTFPERWLPMVEIARQPVLTPRLPWRLLSVALLLIALLVGAAAVFIGSQHRLPAPFGVARNGLIAYARDGDIFATDPVTSRTSAVVTGPETDLGPTFSLDGTHLTFERKVRGSLGAGLLYVVRADGTDLTLVTPDPIGQLNSYAFSPDGREILLSTGAGATSIVVAQADGTGVRTMELGNLVPSQPEFRPPTGDEIVFVGRADGPATGLFAVRPDGSGLRTVVEPSNLVIAAPKWASDGTRIAYTAWAVDYQTNAEGSLARAYVVSADGQGTRPFRDLPKDDLEGVVAWSNDGTRILLSGCYARPPGVQQCGSTFSKIPSDGEGPVIQIDVPGGFPNADGTGHLWAPDDRSILTTPLGPQGRPISSPLLWDPLTGRSQPTPWDQSGIPSWQRLAP